MRLAPRVRCEARGGSCRLPSPREHARLAGLRRYFQQRAAVELALLWARFSSDALPMKLVDVLGKNALEDEAPCPLQLKIADSQAPRIARVPFCQGCGWLRDAVAYIARLGEELRMPHLLAGNLFEERPGQSPVNWRSPFATISPR